MNGPDPLDYAWWLSSRAAGIVALLCITASVGVGLAMAGRVSRNPRLAKTLLDVHQQTALAGLVAIAVHGITLLGDAYLKPGLAGIAIPFVIDHAPLWTGLGVTGGWLAAILGLTYWLRDRIGAARWRKLHRATILVYALSVAHTLGSGTDASQGWMRVLLLATGAPILFLFVVRLLPAKAGATGPAKPAASGRRFRIAELTPESATVLSLALEPADGRPLAPYEPGQFLTVTVDGLTRSYSLSAAPGGPRYRISVKRDRAVSTRLHAAEPGDMLTADGPYGRFVLDEASDAPVALVSVGVGATPVLAMLAQLAATRSARGVYWVHGARRGSEHAFREEVRELVAQLPDATAHVLYSRPDPRDVEGRDYDGEGHVDASVLERLGVPPDAHVYACGPDAFAQRLRQDLPNERFEYESFGGAKPARPAVTFARSDVQVDWDDRFANLLELAEAHDVPAASGCRVGACHGCKAPVVRGRTTHEVDGGALICCARPEGDVVLDL
jgi:ferredoxin-NADP reductase